MGTEQEFKGHCPSRAKKRLRKVTVYGLRFLTVGLMLMLLSRLGLIAPGGDIGDQLIRTLFDTF